jgi:hypothetical protein
MSADPDRACGRFGRKLLPAMNPTDTTNREPPNDWVRRPVSALLLWCLPLCLGFGTNLLHLPVRAEALVWMIVFVWMGAGCVLNARRCHRLHCYISGPIFLLGAVVAGLFASDLLVVSHFNNIVGATLGLALLSFVPEMIWRKYA